MPAILGQFESSLRGRTSIVSSDPSAKMVLHHCCSGASHGHGVKKEKAVREKERERRNCSLPPESSSDESLTPSPPGGVPDLLLHGRTLPSESNRRASVGSVSSRRSSSEVMKRMLYGSATKDDLKNRCIDEADSGLASSDNENSGKEYKRSKSAENHLDDDDEDMTHLRKQQRQERREYYQRHSPKNNASRKESPSPAPKKISLKLRRNSADGSERDSSVSPPLTPPRSSTSTPKSQNNCQTLPRRTKSTSSNTLLTPQTARKASGGGGYAFGSSTERFSQKTDTDHRASQDNLSNSHNNLHRTTSDPRVLGRARKSPNHKSSVTKAWLQFQADIEAAMLKKPGINNGLYKNLTDLMQDRMDQLDQVSTEY